MVVFLSLIIPMPYTWKRGLFTFISSNPLVARMQYGLKVTLRQRYADGHFKLTLQQDMLHIHLDSLC